MVKNALFSMSLPSDPLPGYGQSSFLKSPTPQGRAMTQGNKLLFKMKQKCNCTHMKPNKCIRQNCFKLHNKKYEKVLNLAGLLTPVK
jgi:hypothetical protein